MTHHLLVAREALQGAPGRLFVVRTTRQLPKAQQDLSGDGVLGQRLLAYDQAAEGLMAFPHVVEAATVAAREAVDEESGQIFGPLQVDGLGRHLEGIEEGAELLVGGPDAPEGLPKGYYVKPTVFGKVKPTSTIAQEEIFGPVLSIITYKDEDEAVKIANGTPYGLAGGVWSKDEEHAKKVAKRMRTGQVDINGGPFNPRAPFGGFKQSGNGRELGHFGLEEFLEYKSLQFKSQG